MNYKDSLSGEEYKGRPIGEVVVEIAVMNKVMMQDITSIKEKMTDLQNTKLDKTVMNSYESRLLNIEQKFGSYESDKWKVIGIASGIGLVVAVAAQIFNYLKDAI